MFLSFVSVILVGRFRDLPDMSMGLERDHFFHFHRSIDVTLPEMHRSNGVRVGGSLIAMDLARR